MPTAKGPSLAPIFAGLHPAFDVVIDSDGTVHVFFAGGPVNAALAAQILATHPRFNALNGKARLVTLIGNQRPDLGEFQNLGMLIDWVRVPGWLRHNTYDLRLHGSQAEPEHGVSELDIAPMHVQTFREHFSSVQPNQVVAFTGSLPNKKDRPHEYAVSPVDYADIIYLVLHKGGRVIIDARPQIVAIILRHLRLMFGGKFHEVSARIIVKQNQKEFRRLVGQPDLNGHPGHWVDEARNQLPGGNFIITQGPAGVLLVTPDTQKHFRIHPDHEPEAIATGGCGDALVGGVGQQWSIDPNVELATQVGMGVSQANVLHIRPGRHCPKRSLQLADLIKPEPV